MTESRPFRFFDNRQKYLMFVNTCNEKWRVAERAAKQLSGLRPQPPGIRIFDAGVGDGTVLAHLLAATHSRFPTVPFHVVGKEISLEDMRLTLASLADRFSEHPQLVVTLTNLRYADAPHLVTTDIDREEVVFETRTLDGDCSFTLAEQLRSLDDFIAEHWAVKTSPVTGNPLYTKPTVLTIHRKDQQIALDGVIPNHGEPIDGYDLILASQPWRSRNSADFKAKRILGPLARSLRSGGLMLVIQSAGGDPGEEIIRRIWPEEEAFPVGRHELANALSSELGVQARNYSIEPMVDRESRLTYSMHALPENLAAGIGTPSLLAAWNAAVYVAQIEDERVEDATVNADPLEVVNDVLRQNGGLWFNDETLRVRRS